MFENSKNVLIKMMALKDADPEAYRLAQTVFAFREQLDDEFFEKHEDEIFKLSERINNLVADGVTAAYTEYDYVDAIVNTSVVKLNFAYYLEALDEEAFQYILPLLAEQKRAIYSDSSYDDTELTDALENLKKEVL